MTCVRMHAFSETFQHKVKSYFQSAFNILQTGTKDAVWRRVVRVEEMGRNVESGDSAYPPSEVCGRVWWSVWGWTCFLERASKGGRGRDWAPLRVSDSDGASRTLSAGYSCITAPSWAPSLLQDWQLQWKILSTSLSTWGDSSLPGQSRVTCSHTNTHRTVHEKRCIFMLRHWFAHD